MTDISDRTISRPGLGRTYGLATSPLLWLTALLALLAVLLSVPLTLPLGPFYWDVFIYFDAANRIFSGQLPSIDFFTPAGPLGYGLFAALVAAFPQGQPVLLAQWSLLLVAAPLLALVLADVDLRSRPVALALLIPFLVFAILPFNGEEYYSYPGVDGFGIYNRQCIHLLYVLLAALIFVENRKRAVIVVAGAMTGLFLTKITGFAAGGILCFFAFLAGRVTFREAFAIVGLFAACLAVLEASTGMTSAYVADLLTLLVMNEGVLLKRFLQAASLQFHVVAPGGLLLLALAWLEREALAGAARDLLKTPFPAAAALLDRPVFWLAAALFAGLFFETQNTGSQAFVFIWPVLLLILLRSEAYCGRSLIVVLALVAATALPSLVEIGHRAARAFVGQINYVTLDEPGLKSLGQVSQRPEIVQRGGTMIDFYTRHRETYEAFADRHMLSSFTLFTEPDYQASWLFAASNAVRAIEAYEASQNVRFDTIFSLNFTNPFPWLLNREAPRLVSIGADPHRTVPDPTPQVLASVAATDLVLYPKCPVTDANNRLLSLYRPALADHRRIELGPCWDGFIRAELTGSPGSN